jgi:hypothetical protein
MLHIFWGHTESTDILEHAQINLGIYPVSIAMAKPIQNICGCIFKLINSVILRMYFYVQGGFGECWIKTLCSRVNWNLSADWSARDCCWQTVGKASILYMLLVQYRLGWPKLMLLYNTVPNALHCLQILLFKKTIMSMLGILFFGSLSFESAIVWNLNL